MPKMLVDAGIQEFYIVNPSGSMIYSYTDKDDNNSMVLCSTLHSIYEIGTTINLFGVPKEKNKTVTSSINRIILSSIQSNDFDDKHHFKMVFLSRNKAITIYKTVSGLMFVFIAHNDISHAYFLEIYTNYTQTIAIDPFYKTNQPIKSNKFLN